MRKSLEMCTLPRKQGRVKLGLRRVAAGRLGAIEKERAQNWRDGLK